MARQGERDAGIAYPQLHREQINLIIGALMFTDRNKSLGPDSDATLDTAAYLINFYTKRWGLPASLGVHAARLGART